MGRSIEPDRRTGGLVASSGSTDGPSRERRVAYEVVLAVRGGERADEAFARRALRVPDRRRAFAMELAYGAIRWRGRLDHELDLLLDRGIGSVSAEILSILEIGAYQLRFVEKVPAWAAVDESVKLAKEVIPFPGRIAASKLVNGVLRNYDRRKRDLTPPDDAVRRRVIGQSHPEWLVARWLDRLGPKRTDALLVHDNEPPPLHLAVHPAQGSRENLVEGLRAAGHDARPHPSAPHAVIVDSGTNPATMSGWDEGRMWVQDAGSQWVVEAIGSLTSSEMLDACAAPGTKLLALLARSPGASALGLDVDPARLKLVRRAAHRLRIETPWLAAADARRPPSAKRFDLVLADVPCSGTGVLRRRIDARWRRRPGDPGRFAAFQREILEALADRVAPGGMLLYATCSVEREENQDVVEAFVDDDPRFRIESLEDRVPSELRDGPYLFTGPWAGDFDGMFAARLVREGA